MSNIPTWQRRIALSVFKKEATYNAGVTINSANYAELSGFDSKPKELTDMLADDGGEITGSEYPTLQEIIRQGLGLSINFSKAKPNDVIGLAALGLGNVVSSQDGAFVAYRHKITPIAAGSSLPSGAVLVKDGAQWLHNGITVVKFKLSGKDDGFIACGADLIGSGHRVTDTTGFPAKISESWMKTTQMKVFYESGANISISATPVQAAEDISSGAGTDLSIRIRNFDFEWDNKNFMNYGYGSDVLQENDKGAKRMPSLKFSLIYKDDTELNHYLNQTAVAVEFDAKGALIAAGGAMYFGLDLIIPKCQIKKLGMGEVDGFLSQDYEVTILDNGVSEDRKSVV